MEKKVICYTIKILVDINKLSVKECITFGTFEFIKIRK